MKLKLLSFIIFFNLILNDSFGQETVEIQQSSNKSAEVCTAIIIRPNSGKGKDAFIQHMLSDPAGDNTNYGDFASFEAMAWTWGEFGILRSLIEFDLLDIPPDAIVSYAKLSLFNNPTSAENGGQHSSLSGSNIALLQRITSSWDESTVTWNNQPITDTLNQVYLLQSTSVHEDYLDVDVTAIVSDMVHDPSSNYGFMFKLVTEVQYRAMIFASSDHVDSTLHPKLEICYTVPTSVNKIEKVDEVPVYPNPSSGIFSITLNQQQNDFNNLQVVNYFGQSVFDYSISPSENLLKVDFSDHAKGVYFMILTGDHNRALKKLIIQ